LGPRDDFEETVTLLRATLERRGDGSSNQPQNLTHEDFSFNEVLRLMRVTALEAAGPKKFRMKREDFIRLVNEVMQEKGGLKVAKRLMPRAETGRYAWIEKHIQTFLHRHRDVVRLSKLSPGTLRIVAVRDEP
jgi:hypothetical protein